MLPKIQAETTVADREVRKKELLYLREKLEETHVDLYRNVGREDFTKALDLAYGATEDSFPIMIQEALALLGDAHTMVPEVVEVWGDRIPIRLKEIDGTYYIIGTNGANRNLLFTQLLGVNGHNLETILAAISRLSSKESPEVLIIDNQRILRSLIALTHYGFVQDNVVTLNTDKGNHTVTNFERNEIIADPLDWDSKDISYIGNKNYRYRTHGVTIHFQYNRCSNKGFTEQELLDFKRRLLVKVAKSKDLVVDLRSNNGGRTGVMDDLFKQLPDHLNIYVAMGRETYSSAMHHLLYLKNERGATLIGSNAGQRPNRFGDTEEITLPSTNLLVFCSCKYFQLLPGSNIDTITPDIPLPVTIEDYADNNDPLEKWIEDLK